jgi:antitoxin (DNA-binding transcriptional repressor) of toxin-antitoxin stability system
MRTQIDVNELPARFNEVLALIHSGQEIVVVADGALKARLVAMERKGVPIPDLHPGAFVVGPEFDDPLPEDVWPTQ